MHFSPEERAVLRAVVERILPADESVGAWDAGAEDFLRRQLDGELSTQQEVIRSGLAALDARAHATSATSFASLPPDVQDTLLREVEATSFFLLLVRTTAEGFYSEPAQGGNRDAVSWVMTGFRRDPV